MPYGKGKYHDIAVSVKDTLDCAGIVLFVIETDEVPTQSHISSLLKTEAMIGMVQILRQTADMMEAELQKMMEETPAGVTRQ
jgi:hypothetical protein